MTGTLHTRHNTFPTPVGLLYRKAVLSVPAPQNCPHRCCHRRVVISTEIHERRSFEEVLACEVDPRLVPLTVGCAVKHEIIELRACHRGSVVAGHVVFLIRTLMCPLYSTPNDQGRVRREAVPWCGTGTSSNEQPTSDRAAAGATPRFRTERIGRWRRTASQPVGVAASAGHGRLCKQCRSPTASFRSVDRRRRTSCCTAHSGRGAAS